VSFGIQIRFDDDEMEVLRRVIAHYLRVCRREIKQGGSVPFIAHSGVLKYFRRNVNKYIQILGKAVVMDSDMGAFRAAFSSYLNTCEPKSAKGGLEPSIADKVIARKTWERMSREMQRVMFDEPREWWRRGATHDP
jgi:hypothetical protein